ncbi:type II toxin-antitoxin system RelE/ParE family toxin [Geodermatophilus sp. YIM 151500]|uniref:type II toxin-antitoxin system RelE/ParE family toxin n=1 Tax=Geodermatophilus sp. YIM 151500 TaxID=2984531 RepID=UPI0021E4B131|nr:type II toxin-antitoxin system RelE/ParE family toxin [Geodermatophilus sp. YIM 151500]MCV2489195.1 type II toxin-antitoxin system RelE/ParE family toxin [Geodermatophilus sp. YIM 151500]
MPCWAVVGSVVCGSTARATGRLSGPYRVIYSVRDDEVVVRVVRISHRADLHG